MIPVKTLPKFKCDFCKKRSTRYVMEIHERRCFRNPNRFCDECQNKGTVTILHNDICEGYGGSHEIPCQYCSKFDPEMLKAIVAYEQGDGST